MPRRDFLGLSSIFTAGAALLFATVGMLRLPKAAVLPVPARKFKVTLPETLAPGVAFQPPGRNVAVVRDGDGVFAVSLVCSTARATDRGSHRTARSPTGPRRRPSTGWRSPARPGSTPWTSRS
jgi:hypothetical protein